MLHENDVKDDVKEEVVAKEGASKADRRRFLAQAGLMGLGALGASQLPAAAQTNRFAKAWKDAFNIARGNNIGGPLSNVGPVTDNDVLNFALNLEYLEAEFYVRAAFGRGLANADTDGNGTRGAVSGGRAVNFTTSAIRQYAEEIARDEEAHVKFLRGKLGGVRVARPALNLDSAFTAAARAAGIVGPTGTFDAYASENNFLLAAYIFEDVGVTAYKGSARLISDKDTLEQAAGILAVEAYHAGIIRTVLFSRGLSDPAQKISDLRDSADGSSDLDQGILLNGNANLVPTDNRALAFSRSTAQVRNIVYLSANGTPGGFFPSGLNSRFR